MRVGLFVQTPAQDRALRPMVKLLQPKHRCRISSDFAAIVDFLPHVVLIGEAIAEKVRAALPASLIVQVQTELDFALRGFQQASQADYLAVSSNEIANWHRAVNVHPRGQIWATGFLPMEPLFRGDRLSLPFGLPHMGKTVLYAPAADERISSAPMLGDRAIELLVGHSDDLALLICPDEKVFSQHPEWIREWKALARRRKHVHVVDPTRVDPLALIRAAGVLVTDASPIMLKFLANEMPVVLIDNPQRTSSLGFQQASLIWEWRDMGTRVQDVREVSEAIEHALLHPLGYAEKRLAYRDYLFGPFLDGRSGIRLAEKIDTLAEDVAVDESPVRTSWAFLSTRALMRRFKRIAARKAAAL